MKKENFEKLLDKYLSGEASLEEEQQLLNFYGSFNKDDSANDIIVNKEFLKEEIGNKIFDHISQSIYSQEQTLPSLKLYYLKSISVAAMILITITVGLFFYRDRDSLVSEKFVEINTNNDILPGSNKAILILADGSKISLDDAANGLLASQGNFAITKTDNGQIVYKKNIGGGKKNKGYSAFNTIQTPKGGKYKITLPDGSQVWLNSASTLHYPTSFNGIERKVILKGEAYFEITHNKKVPFRVVSNNQIVEVLGTHFNINSYEDEDYTKTTLLEGSVKVILNSSIQMTSANTKLLKPGEQSLTNSSQSGIRIENADTEKAIAWKSGYFKFKNTPIQEIMREIERWYDVELVYEGKMTTDEFTGFVSNDQKISGVLKILEQSGGVKFSVKGKKIKIKTIQ